MSIKIENLNYTINKKNILSDISLEINNFELVSIIGPNGSGKTTLLKLISGELKPNNGEIKFNNNILENFTIEERSKQRSVMTQSPKIIYDFNVEEIIRMGWLYEIKDSLSKKKYKLALEEVSRKCLIEDLLDRNFNHLSGGEQKRVHFARTLIQIYNNEKTVKDKFMFLDEPTSNLDLFHELKLIKLIKHEVGNGLGVMLIIHNLNLAFKFSNKICILDKGKIIFFGKPNDVNEETLSIVFKIPIFFDKINKNIIMQD